ncbi:PKD domain-containing protein [Mangrovicoccus ximenensis]|uniref:PKD domain-containing protein n=1 Tax=Mangrovicoccus ximenensis TaxID=1911570 RepID=UPI000D395081|nr:PKD domain-containing protein [Mangrovicoccus ximenensis]
MSALVIEATDLVADPIEAVVSFSSTEETAEPVEAAAADLSSGDAGTGILPAADTADATAEAETDADGVPSGTDFQTVETTAPAEGGPQAESGTDAAPLDAAAESSDPASAAEAAGAPATFEVSDAAGLAAALAAAQDGDVIRLAGGSYGDFSLKNYAVSVTLMSDPADPAVFSTVQCDNVRGLAFDGVTFDYTFAEGDAEWHRPFRFANSQDITIRNSLVDGDNAHGRGDEKDGYGNATGLRFQYCEDIRILDSEIRGFRDNIQLNAIKNIVVSGNDIHHMREDAIEFGTLTNALFENNYLHDTAGYPLPEGAAAGSGDHPDFFQINGGGARSPCTNLTFRGNLMDQGSGTDAQGIFLTNKDDVPWQNITIEDNMYINGRANGIVVGLTDGLIVKNNTIVHAFWDTENSFVPTIRLDSGSTNAVVTGNIAGSSAILNLPESWETGSNFVVQSTDPQKPDYYTEHFAGAEGELGGHPEKFLLKADSPIRAAGAGSEHVTGEVEAEQAETTETADLSGLVARILIEAADSPDQFVFDASLSSLPEIQTASSAYAGPFARFDDATGDLVLATDHGDVVVADLEAGALDLRGLAAPLGILRTDLQPLLEAESFCIDMVLGLAPGAAGPVAGEVMRLDRAFLVKVTEKGDIDFRLKTVDGIWHQIKTAGAGLTDGNMHDVSLRYAAAGEIQVVVDGTVLATAEIGAAMAPGVSDRMSIGGQYGSTPFAGLVQDIAMTLDADATHAGGLFGAADVQLASTGGSYSFLWSFGDGSQAEGIAVEHSFDVPGYHTVTLTVTGSDGSISSTDYTVGIPGTGLVGFDSQSGDFCRLPYGEMSVIVDLSPGAIDLRDLDSPILIDRAEIQPMVGAEEFSINMVLRLDPSETGGIGGEVMRLDRAFQVNVTNAGELDLRLKTTDGIWHRLITKGAGIGDGDSHGVSVRFDADDVLQIVVDDAVLGETAVAGMMDPGIGSVMVIGGQYGATAFGGLLEELRLDLDAGSTLDAGTFDAVSGLLAAEGGWTEIA